jgi:hypothetical protein
MHLLGFFFFPFFGFGFVLYFFPTNRRPDAREARQAFHLPAEFLLRMERNWLGYIARVGLQERSSRLRPVATALVEQPRRFLCVVGKNDAGAGAPDRDQRFHHHAIPVNPIITGGGLDHRVLA